MRSGAELKMRWASDWRTLSHPQKLYGHGRAPVRPGRWERAWAILRQKGPREIGALD